jgi:hypothetical protein
MSKRIKYSLSNAYKGERLPENSKKVDRSTKYGNPFKVGSKVDEFTRDEALRLYTIYLDFVVSKKLLDLKPLKGYDLACSCDLLDSCHVDILLNKLNKTI